MAVGMGTAAWSIFQALTIDPVLDRFDKEADSIRMIDKQPSNDLYHKKNMKQALQYAIKNWDDPIKRDQALDVLARQDDKLMNVKAINGICGLDGLNDSLAEMVFGGNRLAVGVNGQLVDGGMGGLFSKVNTDYP